MWIFSFYDTDIYENRAHIHVGKRGTTNLCKIWLEPVVELASQGDFTKQEANQAVRIAQNNSEDLLNQWNLFKQAQKLTIIKK